MNIFESTFKNHKKYLFEALGLNEIRMSREDAIKIFTNFGVPDAKNLSTDDLKKKYRDLATKHHPDMGGETRDMQDITNAYDVLKTPNYTTKTSFTPPRDKPKNTSTPTGSDDDDDDVGDNVIEADFGADILNGNGYVEENEDLAESIQYAIKEALGTRYINSRLNKTEDEYFGVHFSFKGTEEWWWRQGSDLVYAKIEPILEDHYETSLRGLRRFLDYGIHLNHHN